MSDLQSRLIAHAEQMKSGVVSPRSQDPAQQERIDHMRTLNRYLTAGLLCLALAPGICP